MGVEQISAATRDVHATLLLHCADRPGIVAAVASWLADTGGNITDAAQHHDAAHDLFLQRIEFDHRWPVRELRSSFAPLADQWDMSWELTVRDVPARLVVACSSEPHCVADVLARCATGDLGAEVVEVISDRQDLSGLVERFGVGFRWVPVVLDDREAHEAPLRSHLAELEPDVVVLARYMRVLSARYCEEFGDRTINIHHSFLPAFVGAAAYRLAWERGVKLVGATAHYVTPDLDAGPIIAQDVVRVAPADSPAQMARRGRDLEARVLTAAVRAHLERRVITYAGRTVVFE